MKYLRLVSIFLAILAVLIIAVPAFAANTYTYNKVDGIEISAGSYVGTNTEGATFTAAAIKFYPFSSGLLYASVNYHGNGPNIQTHHNDIYGGNWSLKVTIGKSKGTIIGKITGGFIDWKDYKNMTDTGIGIATIYLSITGGTDGFANITGSGRFDGYDIHASGLYILGIQVPVVRGQLSLTY